MADIAQAGLGTTLSYADISVDDTQIPLSTLIDINPPDLEVKIAEYQPLSGPSARRKLSASYNTGDMKFRLVHGASMMYTLQGLRGNNTLSWQITLPDGTTTEVFYGIIKTIGREIKVDEVTMIDVTLAVDGDVTFSDEG